MMHHFHNLDIFIGQDVDINLHDDHIDIMYRRDHTETDTEDT